MSDCGDAILNKSLVNTNNTFNYKKNLCNKQIIKYKLQPNTNTL